MSLEGFVKITRPVNSVVAGLAAVVAYLIATGTIIPTVILIFVIVALITAAGNIINDYFDADIDRINRPERPIPSGTVTMGAAKRIAVVFFLAGICASVFTTPLCLGIAIFNSLLLVAYASRFKGTPLIGNIVVSYLSASMFLFGGALNGWTGLVHIVPIAVITFFSMLTRELLKDAEDVKGDMAGGAETLPIRIGIKKTSLLAFMCACIAVAASAIPFFWWGTWYLAGIAVVDAIILVGAFRAISCVTSECIQNSGASRLLKMGMFASLIIFTVSAIFLQGLT
jgi:geranylgeranylglycerol-phosphate geranylgeranyltransferase